MSAISTEAGSALIDTAHLLKRTSMGVHAERVAELGGLSWDDAVSAVLDAAVSEVAADDGAVSAPVSDDWAEPIVWWLERMTEPGTGLRDRMAWFWHGLLTTSVDKVDAQWVGPQIDLLRRRGLGNFRSLMHEFVIDPALLQFLDGAGSMANNPNENLARELMELFTIGRTSSATAIDGTAIDGTANYSQDDVRAAARALAGWVILGEDDEGGPGVSFDRSNAFNGPLVFLGEQAEWDTAMIVDRLCDDPATHGRIAARIWRHLAGTWLADDAANKLGQYWASVDLEIAPLVERILRSDEFRTARNARPRTGVEWWCAQRSALNSTSEIDPWGLTGLSQMPYRPPNVAGWPDDERWLSASSLLARAATVWNVDPAEVFAGLPSDTASIIDRCAIHGASGETIAAIDNAGEPDMSPDAVHYLRWRIALTSPEFNLT